MLQKVKKLQKFSKGHNYANIWHCNLEKKFAAPYHRVTI